MESFPENINRADCLKVLIKNQGKLIKEVRAQFTTELQSAIEKHSRQVTLTFPDLLWKENRATIASELLERFGEIIMQTEEQKYEINQSIDNVDAIPHNVKKLIINF